jgi:hypothetical protein
MLNLLTAHDLPDVDIRVAWGLHDHDDISINSFLCLNDESQDVWISNERDALLIRMKRQGVKVFRSLLSNPKQRKGWVRNRFLPVGEKNAAYSDCSFVYCWCWDQESTQNACATFGECLGLLFIPSCSGLRIDFQERSKSHYC